MKDTQHNCGPPPLSKSWGLACHVHVDHVPVCPWFHHPGASPSGIFSATEISAALQMLRTFNRGWPRRAEEVKEGTDLLRASVRSVRHSVIMTRQQHCPLGMLGMLRIAVNCPRSFPFVAAADYFSGRALAVHFALSSHEHPPPPPLLRVHHCRQSSASQTWLSSRLYCGVNELLHVSLKSLNSQAARIAPQRRPMQCKRRRQVGTSHFLFSFSRLRRNFPMMFADDLIFQRIGASFCLRRLWRRKFTFSLIHSLHNWVSLIMNELMERLMGHYQAEGIWCKGIYE